MMLHQAIQLKLAIPTDKLYPKPVNYTLFNNGIEVVTGDFKTVSDACYSLREFTPQLNIKANFQ